MSCGFLNRLFPKRVVTAEQVKVEYSEISSLPKKFLMGSFDELYDDKQQLRILAFADLHYWETEELQEILKYEYDICVLLGDIPRKAILEILELTGNKLVLAVQGNHDSWDMFDGIPVVDLHKTSEEFCGVRFAGFGGSVRYKNGPYAMHTQEESVEFIKDLPAADILLSHDCMYGVFGKEGSHAGLKGINVYIKRNQVKLNLCGHHHQMFVKEEEGCTTVCVYRCAMITFPKVSVKQIF